MDKRRIEEALAEAGIELKNEASEKLLKPKVESLPDTLPDRGKENPKTKKLRKISGASRKKNRRRK